MTDNEKATCPVCGKEVNSDDLYCRHCGSEIKTSPAFTEDTGEEEYPDLGLAEEDYIKTAEELESDLSELDYEPKKKSGFMIPTLIIILVLGMVIGGIYILSSTEDGQIAVDDTPEIPEVHDGNAGEENGADNANGAVTEPTEPDEDHDENGLEEEIPPDHELLESAMKEWLTERVGDPDVILLHTDELEDFDKFFDTYDLEEDNIIVFMVESTEEEFATVLLGPPFSEWSIKAVFIWREDQWDFLREETIG